MVADCFPEVTSLCVNMFLEVILQTALYVLMANVLASSNLDVGTGDGAVPGHMSHCC